MTNLTKINDHLAQAQNRVISQFRSGVNFGNLIKIMGERAQEFEDALFEFYRSRLSVENAQGIQLDNIGRLVGQARLGYSDDLYRVLIYARIGANNSRGTGPNLIEIAQILTSGQDRDAIIQYFNLEGGEVAIGTDGNFPLPNRSFLIENLDDTPSAGVRLAYICFYLPGNEGFAFAGGDGGGFGTGGLASVAVDQTPFTLAGEGPGGGLGSVHDPLTGGVFTA